MLSNVATADKNIYQSAQVHLLDCSTFKQEGTNGKEIRLHLDYNLSLGAMGEVKLTDKYTAESVQSFTIKSGHIYLADAGYGTGNNLDQIVSRGAQALFRASPNCIRLSSDKFGGAKINMAEKLDTKKNILDFPCYIHTSAGNYIPVRLIASRLPEDKVMLAKERKKRIASRKQQKLKKETLVYAEWVILITSLDTSFTAEFLLEMYRSRWQIELLFKRIKQFFKVTKLRKATLEHSKALVMVWLIIFAMAERRTIAAEIHMISKELDTSFYSHWLVIDFFLRQFHATINALWAYCFDVETHIFSVLLRLQNHKSKRRSQYSSFHFAAY